MRAETAERAPGAAGEGAGVAAALRSVPAGVAFLLLAAHFNRGGDTGLVALYLAAPLLLLWRRRWVPGVLGALLAAGFVEWVRTTVALMNQRSALGLPATRLGIILGAVALFTAFAALMLRERPLADWYRGGAGRGSSAAAFVLAGLILLPVQLVVDPPGLLLERFWPTGGWLEMGLLGVYAAWLVDNLSGPRPSVWRRRLWTLFSVAFFVQLVLGLSGLDRFLMTGRLHLPVPALIVAGPLFRGDGLFMPILFGATVLLVGPAWCSHLCYIGAWDHELARRVRRPRSLPPWHRRLQAAFLVGAVAVPLTLRSLGVPGSVAIWPAVAFGVAGVAVMALWSRRRGAMAHCTAFCPIGVLSTTLGRLNPFRVRVGTSCTQCGACTGACRYGALGPRELAERAPGPACTLCGDCLERCRDGQLSFAFPGLSASQARAAFVVLVVALHAAFLGVARI